MIQHQQYKSSEVSSKQRKINKAAYSNRIPGNHAWVSSRVLFLPWKHLPARIPDQTHQTATVDLLPTTLASASAS